MSVTVYERESRFQTTFFAVPVGLVHLSIEGSWLEVNSKFCEMVGYAETELKLLALEAIAHPEDRAMLRQGIEQLSTRIILTYTQELRCIRKDKTLIWLHLTLSHIANEDSSYLLGTITEVTADRQNTLQLQQYKQHLERLTQHQAIALSETSEKFLWEKQEKERAQQDLQNNSNLLRAVIDSIPDVVFVKDTEGHFLLLNAAGVRTLNRPLETILGKTDVDLFGAETGQIIRNNDQKLLATAIPQILEETIEVDGQLRSYLSTKNVYRDPQGHIIGIVGITQDTTERKALEKELALRQAWFNAFFEAAPAGMLILDNQLKYVQVNRAAAEVNGIAASEHIGKTASQMLPELAPVIEPLYREVLTTGCSMLDLEVSGETPKRPGELRHWQVSYFPLRGEDGEICGLGVVGIEISDRKRAEAAKQESESRYRAIVEDQTELIVRFLPNGTVTFVNQAYCRYFDLTAEEIVGRSFFYLLPESSLQRVKQLINSLTPDNPVATDENSVCLANGEIRWCQWTDRLLFDEQGNVRELQAVGRDITDRKQAEIALQESEQRYQILAQLSPVGIFQVDANGYCFYVNDRTCELAGLTRQDALGIGWIDALHPDDVERVTNAWAIATQCNQLFQTEFRFLHADSKITWVLCQFLPETGGDGAVKSYVGSLTDISDRVLAEQAMQQSEAKLRERTTQLEQTLRELQQAQAQLIQSEKMSSLGQLVAGIAHEINNPVNFIYGNLNPAKEYVSDLLELVQLYQDTYLNPIPEILDLIESIDLEFLQEDLPKLLDSMEIGADRIRQIVLSLRNFSRLDEAEMKAVNIHEGIDSTLLILQNRIKIKTDRPAIEVVKEYGDLPLVECYAGQLNQVFMNIITNAIDALEDYNKARSLSEINANPSKIWIRTEFYPENSSIKIQLIDNGPGIPPAILEQLFNPFFTTKPIGQGTGLGLAISQQIVVEKHGGKLECFSELGQGAEFSIEIPINQSTAKS